MSRTSTLMLNMETLKQLAKEYDAAQHSKEREHAGNQVMMMLDAIIERLEHAAASN